MTATSHHGQRRRTPPPKRHGFGARYQVRIPLNLGGQFRGRSTTRYAFTYRAALRIANEELGYAWSGDAHHPATATIRKWYGRDGGYLPPVRFERPELDGPMLPTR